jgi:death-on-curing protein
LTRNHGFADGNKRTAFLIVDLFLYRCGYRLESKRGEGRRGLERLILRIVENHPEFDEIADWFKLRIRKRFKKARMRKAK